MFDGSSSSLSFLAFSSLHFHFCFHLPTFPAPHSRPPPTPLNPATNSNHPTLSVSLVPISQRSPFQFPFALFTFHRCLHLEPFIYPSYPRPQLSTTRINGKKHRRRPQVLFLEFFCHLSSSISFFSILLLIDNPCLASHIPQPTTRLKISSPRPSIASINTPLLLCFFSLSPLYP